MKFHSFENIPTVFQLNCTLINFRKNGSRFFTFVDHQFHLKINESAVHKNDLSSKKYLMGFTAC